MSLMRLAPECVRLRRLARAWAAGELTEHDYRAARREVIDAFVAVPPADDDTRRRSVDEPTLRRVDSADDDPAATLAAVPASPRHRWRLLAALLLALMFAIATGAPLAHAADGSQWVPAVRERDPDPASSPRLSVESVAVRWAGSGDPADPAGLSLADLQRTAEQRLGELRVANAAGPHGFTASELAEVGRFLNVLGVHESGSLDAADARDLGALIRDQKARRGVSVAQLEEVARSVQGTLRAAGYFLGVAYLPSQQVDASVVRIDVLPGRLGEIVVDGGDPGPVTGVFASLQGEPLTLEEVSGRLQTLNALPGFSAQASFGPGQAVGESTLHLDLLEQRAWTASAAIDNHGDSATGDGRLSTSGAWLNPRGAGDRLSAGLLATADPANQTYGYLEYETPLARRYRVSARVGNNDFSVDGADPLDGSGRFFDLAARRDLLQSRERALTGIVGISRQSLDWDDGVDQQVSMVNAGLAGHRVWDLPRIAVDAALNATAGHVGGDRFAGQDAHFWLLEMDTEAWMPVTLPYLPDDHKLRLHAAGQWSDSLLPATRRFALGGAHRARGFDRGAFLADRGVLLGLEIRIPLGLGELLVFGEAAYGDDRTEGAKAWRHLADLGIGWEAQLSRGLFSRLSWAAPVTNQGTGDFEDDDDRWYWSLDYRY